MNSTNVILKINDLSKSFYSLNDEIEVLKNINFEINKGEFIGIIGPSGCGKSSILNILANLDHDYKGTINKKNNIKIGYMFQEDALFPWLTIYDNCLLGLKISKTLNKESKENVNKLLKKYELLEFKNKYPYELSGGMKQRVA